MKFENLDLKLSTDIKKKLLNDYSSYNDKVNRLNMNKHKTKVAVNRHTEVLIGSLVDQSKLEVGKIYIIENLPEIAEQIFIAIETSTGDRKLIVNIPDSEH